MADGIIIPQPFYAFTSTPHQHRTRKNAFAGVRAHSRAFDNIENGLARLDRRHRDAAPATLIRAARDFAIKEPAFAAQVGLHAIAHLLAGRGYEPSPFDIDEAVGHVMAASARTGQEEQAQRELERLATNVPADDQMLARLQARIAQIR